MTPNRTPTTTTSPAQGEKALRLRFRLAVVVLLCCSLYGEIFSSSPVGLFVKADVAFQRGRDLFLLPKTFPSAKPFLLDEKNLKTSSSMTTMSRHVAAWRRVGASYQNILILSDIDDTLWSSGAWRVGRKTLGGVDEDFLRGQAYPGIAALFFVLSYGPHVTTKAPNVCIPACPAYIRSPLFQTCPVSPFDGESSQEKKEEEEGRVVSPPHRHLPASSSSPLSLSPPSLPPTIGLLTARASTSALKNITRPASFYTAVGSALVHGARQMYPGSHRHQVESWGSVCFENDIEFLRDFLGGQHTRGRAKISGYRKAAAEFPQKSLLFFGDLGERDVEVGAGIALYDSQRFVSMFAHVVFDMLKASPSSFKGEGQELSEGETISSLPKHASRFDIEFNGHKIPAIQLTYSVEVRLHPKDPEPVTFAQLSDTHLYSAGMLMGRELKPLMIDLARESIEALTQGKQPRPLPTIFLKFNELHVRRSKDVHPQTTTNPLKRLYRRLSIGIRKGVSRMLSLQWDEGKDIAAYTSLIPVVPEGGQSRTQPSGRDLGVPFIPYRGALGAGISAFILEMITLQDLINLAIAAVRDYRSLGPPESCAQRDTLDEILSDLRLMKILAGDALTVSGGLLDNLDLFHDAVKAMEAFQARADHMCYEGEATPIGVSWLESREGQACIFSFGLQNSIGPDPVARIPPPILPLARFTCENLEKLRHWKSLGGEELEVLALGFSLALSEAVGFSNASSLTNGSFLAEGGEGEEQEAPLDLKGDERSFLATSSSPSSSSFIPPVEECPWTPVHLILRDMRSICERQKKSKKLRDSPCATMSRVLYEEGLLGVFQRVSAWLGGGAKKPLHLDDLRLVIDPVSRRVDDLTKKASGHFQIFNTVGLSRGRGHKTYDLEELRTRHEGTPFVLSSVLSAACNIYAA
ncbi:transmembrane protein [Cystoisospora suis]|uniref:Transmembrane protein n=1 Tax=Cystoisospora suis TaxID=483139 RepID=A0A2C6LHI8_9APIC|nr:transmembrane protein [Cystoisospora suis]